MSGLKFSQTVSVMGLLSVIAISATPVAALAKDKDREDPMAATSTPCPVNGTILTASSEITNRFSVLAQCAPQVVETPATPEDFPHEGTVTITSDNDGSDDGYAGYGAVGSTDKYAVTVEKREDAGVRYTRIVPPEQPSESYYGATPYGVPTGPSPYYTPYSGGAANGGSGMTIASSGAVAATQGMSAQAGANPQEAQILTLRPRSYASQYDDMIEQAARRHGVDPLMLHAVIFQESRYKQQARSHVGARGLMQIMPGTGAQLGVTNAGHLYDPATNINAGAKLLKQLWTKYNGRFDLVLAAYNAGPGAVAKYGNAVPPYRETRDYVVKVQGHYKKLAAENGMTPTGF